MQKLVSYEGTSCFVCETMFYNLPDTEANQSVVHSMSCLE